MTGAPRGHVRDGALERGARALATAGAVVGLDQLTKAWAVSGLASGDPLNVFFGVDLNLVRNRGVAFGALDGASGAAIAALTGVAILGLVAYFARHPRLPGLWLPVGAVLGGAVGNLVDRAREGAVIDFVDPAFWPAFNLADVAIVLGVFGVLYVAEGPREDRAAGREAPGERPRDLDPAADGAPDAAGSDPEDR